MDPFADPVVPRDPAAIAADDLDWIAEIPVTEGKFAGYTLLASAFTGEEVEAVAICCWAARAGFPLERRTLLVYLRARCRVPARHVSRRAAASAAAGRSKDVPRTPRLSTRLRRESPVVLERGEEFGARTGGGNGGVSFTEATRRKFSSLARRRATRRT